MTPPLGKNQVAILQSLRRHGYWQKNAGWIWDTKSGTQKLMDGLVARGLVKVEKTDDGHDRYTAITPE